MFTPFCDVVSTGKESEAKRIYSSGQEQWNDLHFAKQRTLDDVRWPALIMLQIRFA